MTDGKSCCGEVILFQAEDGKTCLDVQLDHETVWLNQAQMVALFERDVSVVSRHIRNVFAEGELPEKSNLQKLQIANSDRPVVYYSLDVIISVGYRVKSKRGTQFRQWATRVLRDHLVKGYTIHEQRLREETAKLREMQQTVDLLARTLTTQQLVTETGQDVLRVINDYAYALATLDRYDHGTLSLGETTGKTLRVIDYEEGIGLVKAMKGEFDGLFGIEKDQGFKSALGRPSTARSSIRASRRRRRISSTSWSKTMLSATATSASPPLCSSIFSPATASSIAPTAPSVWPTTPRWH